MCCSFSDINSRLAKPVLLKLVTSLSAHRYPSYFLGRKADKLLVYQGQIDSVKVAIHLDRDPQSPQNEWNTEVFILLLSRICRLSHRFASFQHRANIAIVMASHSWAQDLRFNAKSKVCRHLRYWNPNFNPVAMKLYLQQITYRQKKPRKARRSRAVEAA